MTSLTPDFDRPPGLRVLLVEGDQAVRNGCASFFQAAGCTVRTAGTITVGIEQAHASPCDLLLVDLDLSTSDALTMVRAVNAAQPDALVVVTTAMPANAIATVSASAACAGVWDYLLKPFTPDHLAVLLGRATHVVLSARSGGRRAKAGAPALAALPTDPRGVACVGESPAFRRAVELALRVAPSDASVMIAGESGTGKEVLAQLIHRHSRRAGKRLVAVNCAALPEALLESEVLGHRKGAFTGADRDKPGLLEVAHGGTFFLDEVTEMSPRLQAKLLRVVQDGVVRRVGSEQNDAQVDVRFVSATNMEPHEAVSRGLLRKDLFYRLRVVLIELPPLRDRAGDIPLLAEHFLAQSWRKFRGAQYAPPRLAPATVSFLASRPWYGNVRELQNVVEHLAVMAHPGGTIRPDDVPLYDEPVEAGNDLTIPPAFLEQDYYHARDQIVAEFDRVYLTRLVGRTGGNMSKAARIASIDRTTLYRLVERYGLNGRDGREVAGPAERDVAPADAPPLS